MGSQESGRIITGWAAKDSSGHLSPYSYSLRYFFLPFSTTFFIFFIFFLIKYDLLPSNLPVIRGYEEYEDDLC